jgi:hypothetical protein
MKKTSAMAIGSILVWGFYCTLCAAVYLVGPARTYKTLQDVAGLLQAADTVKVDGNATYPADVYLTQSGTAGSWITIHGIQPAGGTRPVITGSGAYGINITADHVMLQGFEVSGGPKGIGVFGDNIIVRGCVIHGCNHGLIGYGTGTGSVTVEYCELYGNGVPTGGATQHQIYMATDEYSHPGSVFRLQYCYIHDGVEGDNVKSRAERNEIYYNWIELAGSSGHGLGLFAPDPDDNENVDITTAREDADVVGNVIIQDHNACARIGGDAPGYPTNGRYRFVNNTFICTGSRGDAVRTFNTIETLEMYNNVVYGTVSGSDLRVVNDADGAWVHSPRSVAGSSNWVISGATMVPGTGEWTNTLGGSVSPFADAAAENYLPSSDSVLVDAGAMATPAIAPYPFPNPLFPPAYHPPRKALIDTGAAEVRPVDGTIDIGAFEFHTTGVIRGLQNGRHVFAYGNNTIAYLYRLDGRLVRAVRLVPGRRKFAVSDLSITRPGVYVVRLRSGAGTGGAERLLLVK